MSRSTLLIILMFGYLVSYGQNISVTFTGTGAVTQIESVTATNLTTNQSVTLPGNETLVLTVNTGVPTVPELAYIGIVFPNPFSGKATFMAVVQKPQTVYLKVQNLVGQVVAQKKSFVQPGENEFTLSVSTAGIYLVSLTTEQRTASYKVICTDGSTLGNSIQDLGSGFNNQNNPSQSRLKSSNTGFSLGYTLGDVILYRCKSGIHTTIVTDSPVASKNYEVEFVACTDPDGMNYPIVKIGEQTWMAENLAYLPSVSPSSDVSETSPFYYVFGYEGNNVGEVKSSTNYTTYGVLYNWEAAKYSCPSGWHLPSDTEWTTLVDHLGSSAGGKMKETGTTHWAILNMGATNESGFTALPGGSRDGDSGFYNLGYDASFWSSSGDGLSYAWDRNLGNDYDGVDRGNFYRSYGFSVRCLRNGLATITTTEVTGITPSTASSGGNITSDGGGSIIARGVCWASDTDFPTTAHPKTMDGTGTGSFTSNLKGLHGNTRYFVRAYATNNFVGTSYGASIIFKTSIDLPTVMTTDISAITPTTALSGGNVKSDGGASITARGVCWSISSNPTISDSKTNDGTGTGSFTSSITGLTAGAPFYIQVRAYATNSAGTSYGNQVSFKTSPVLPTVTTTAVSEITQTTALSGGNVTSDGGGSITARGVCWAPETDRPTTDHPHTTDGTGNGLFLSTLTGLIPNARYFVRAYATNSAGTNYGNPISFKTSPVPPITTTAISAITQTTASSGGNITSEGGTSITARGVCWSTSSNPTTADNKTTDGTGSGSFTSNLTGLHANTTYYVRTYAISSSVTNYGNSVSFKTSPGLPTVTTTAISSITHTTASSGGNVTSDVGASIFARGVCWATDTDGPTTDHPHTTNGTGNGLFTSNLTGLTANTTYYVRAYAISSTGTGYGNSVRFKTSPVPPMVATTAISEITQTTASSGGNVTNDGGAIITARGVCWAPETDGPTTDRPHTTDGTGNGLFSSILTGLIPDTRYFVRAYATNSAGTSYGDPVSFRTKVFLTCDGTFTDARDGQQYCYKIIGTQTWMSQNLAYLPAVSPSATGSETAIHYYVYGYQGISVSAAKATANYTTYGVLYNWEAAKTACPSGWHLPSDAEWTVLTDYLTNNGYGYGGSGGDIGKSMASISGWTSYSTAGTIGNNQASNNSSGFTVRPGGGRGSDGSFGNLGGYALVWSASGNDASTAWYRSLTHNYDGVHRFNIDRSYGFSVRCLQD